MPAAELPACVFCGQPIGPGEEVAGRAPMAAHAACADAALADDTHWDAVSSASGATDEPLEDGLADEPQRAATGERSRGCLSMALALVLAAAPLWVIVTLLA